MAYDISDEIDIITSSVRGEDVRDAIIRAFRKVSASSIGVTLTQEEWDSLTITEKNNGTMYFISDLDFIDGDEYYFSDAESSDKILVSHNYLKTIIDKIKQYFSITTNLSISDAVSLINNMSNGKWIGNVRGPLPPLRHIASNFYISNSTTYIDAVNEEQHVVEVYYVEKGVTYLIFVGEPRGRLFRVTFFSEDPTYPNLTSGVIGTNVYGSVNAASWTNVKYTAPNNGYLVLYLDDRGNNDAIGYVVSTDSFLRIE